MIYLIRHGQASFLQNDYDQLSELGKKQSSILGKSLSQRNQRADLILGGSLKRHKQTASNCLKELQHDQEMLVDTSWNEYDHMELISKYDPKLSSYEAIGSYLEMKADPMKELQQILNASLQDWISAKHSYSQSWEAFKSDVNKSLVQIAERLDKGQNAWIFTSGGPISVVLIELLDLKDQAFTHLQGRIVNSSITKILVSKETCTLSTYNEYSHLDHDRKLITYR
ncbi:MAG: histidine phosphatase family protein [Ekhidna sp.]|nr:histidine phosphatase family protein [Ekhidna sp.]